MKTIELMKKYKRDGGEEPSVLWERLVWMAARLVASAEEARHTRRKPNGKQNADDRQMELFKC